MPSVEAIGAGPVASLEARAALFTECAAQAMAAADEAFADAAKINHAHEEISAQHRKLFLAKAFRINPDGSDITNPALLLTKKSPEYNSVKTVEQYNYIINCLKNWGDNALLKTLPEDEVQRVKAFRKKNKNGYNYERIFRLQVTESPDGTSNVLLIHKKSNGIVSHVLGIFDVIHEAHCRMGHMRIEKTLANCRPQFYSPTYDLCKLYLEDCYVCHEKQPSIPARKGAKKPIISSHFRDRIQVDLIDMRTMRKRDVYGNMQRWIMTVKDHSTGLVYLAALPRKKAEYVAAELEKFFGFCGFPHILHTDNGKEFIATLVVDMMMRHNPNCFIVTGRPRTPRDQGSVENANKLVTQVLMSISRQRRSEGIPTNWTKILGQVMSVCNSHSGIRKFSTSSYEAVFGLPYHPELRCTVAEMRECKTIEQRLMLSPDERLATYVRENKIVDYITKLSGAHVSDLDEGDNDGDDENEGVDVTDDAFPEAFASNDCDNEEDFSSSVLDIDFSASADFFPDPSSSVLPSAGGSLSIKSPTGDGEDTTPVDACGTDATDVTNNPSVGEIAEIAMPPPAVTDHHNTIATNDASNDALSLALSSTTEGEDFNLTRPSKVYTRSPDFSVFTVEEAWKHVNIARQHKSLGDNCEYKFLTPTLTCELCCHPNGCFTLQVGEDRYMEAITNSTNWYDGIFISTFAQLAAHYAHSTVDLRDANMTYPHVLPQLIHVTYATGELRVDQCRSLHTDTTTVVAVCHDKDHYGVLEIDLKKQLIRIYDGLNRDLDRWLVYVFYALKRCMLCPLTATPQAIPDEAVHVLRSGNLARVSRQSIDGYRVEFLVGTRRSQ